MRNRVTTRSLALATALLAIPATAHAQVMEDDAPYDEMASAFEAEFRGGMALPVEQFTEYADPGYHLGAGAAVWLNDHVGFRVDGDVSAFPGETPQTDEFEDIPDMRLWHAGAGLEFDVGGRDRDAAWSLQANVGVGATTLSTDEFLYEAPTEASPSMINVSETYPNLNGGVEVGYEATDNIELAVGTRAFYTFVDEAELEPLRERRAVTDPLENAVSMPVTATVRFDLPNR